MPDLVPFIGAADLVLEIGVLLALLAVRAELKRHVEDVDRRLRRLERKEA